ncbi:hypothetical protein BT69DRAFT_636484 [Atractiella rhizophila]|nr:hypothetical protein BT69DRAFT_636484 [Atractiella rhizophila]
MELRVQSVERAYQIRKALNSFCSKHHRQFGSYDLKISVWQEISMVVNILKLFLDATMILQCTSSHLGDVLPTLYRLHKSLVKVINDPTKQLIHTAVQASITKLNKYYEPMKSKKNYILATGSHTTIPAQVLLKVFS